MQPGEGGRVLVDPQKLAQFFHQLHTIQAKIASLQQERIANVRREQSLEVCISIDDIYLGRLILDLGCWDLDNSLSRR